MDFLRDGIRAAVDDSLEAFLPVGRNGIVDFRLDLVFQEIFPDLIALRMADREDVIRVETIRIDDGLDEIVLQVLE